MLLLEDDNREFAYSKRDFINVGDDNGVLFESNDFSLKIRDVGKSDIDYESSGLVIKCEVLGERKDDIILCYSSLLNVDEKYTDDFIVIEKWDYEIEIFVDSCEYAYSDNRSACFHFALENGKGGIWARCNSLRIDYNVFSGKYQYQIIKRENVYGGKRTQKNEIELRVNSVGERTHWEREERQFFLYNTIPIEIINMTDRDIAIEIDFLDVDEVELQKNDFIGICDLSDVIFLKGFSAFEFLIVMEMDYMPDHNSHLDISFIEIATCRRFVYEFQSDCDNGFELEACYIYFHEDF